MSAEKIKEQDFALLSIMSRDSLVIVVDKRKKLGTSRGLHQVTIVLARLGTIATLQYANAYVIRSEIAVRL